MKQGSTLESQRLSAKSCWFLGRVPDCDLQMHHESVSRYHAVLQYGDPASDGRKCWFIYDLGSTHGTRLDNVKINSNEFKECKDGSVIQLGASTRTLVISYPYTPSEARGKMIDNIEQREASVFPMKKTDITLENAPGELKRWLRSNGFDDELDIEISQQNMTDEHSAANDSSSHFGKSRKAAALLGMLSLSVFGRDGENEFLKVTATAQGKPLLTQKLCMQMIDQLKKLEIFSSNSHATKRKRKSADDDIDNAKRDRVNTYKSLLRQRQDLEEQLSSIRELWSNEKNESLSQGTKDETDELEVFMSNINADLKVDTVQRLQAKIESLQRDIIYIDQLVEIAKPNSI